MTARQRLDRVEAKVKSLPKSLEREPPGDSSLFGAWVHHVMILGEPDPPGALEAAIRALPKDREGEPTPAVLAMIERMEASFNKADKATLPPPRDAWTVLKQKAKA